MDANKAGARFRTADLGDDPAEAAGSLAATWTSLCGLLNTGKGQKMGAAEVRQAAVAGLRKQYFLNLLLLAGLFPGDEAKGEFYHPQALLENPERKEDDDDNGQGAPVKPAGGVGWETVNGKRSPWRLICRSGRYALSSLRPLPLIAYPVPHEPVRT